MKKITVTMKTITMIFGWLLVGYGPLVTSVWSGEGHVAMKNSHDAVSKSTGIVAPETRIIYGTVEGLTDTHIKVDSGEAGEMTPRYLEIEKLSGKEDDLEVGDRLKIMIGSQNLVQDYSKAEKQ